MLMPMHRLLFMIFILLSACQPAQAETYAIDGDTVGAMIRYIVRPGDTLYDIARRFDLGIVEVMAANPGIDPWLPEEGAVLILPAMHILPAVPRDGIVINLPELRLFYFPDPYTVLTFPIGIGKQGWGTPTGTTRIVKKREGPVWIPPDSIHAETPGLPSVIPAGPDNPLGTHALNLGWAGFVIHGTNRPYGVGRRSSHGCIRLYPEDIPVLFEKVRIGTKVTVIDAPYKAGWQNRNFLLEISPEQGDADEIMEFGAIQSHPRTDGIETVIQRAAREGTHIDWRRVDEAIWQRNGLPVPMGWKSGPDE